MHVREKILKLLKQYPKGVRQADIVRALGVSKSRVSEVVKELEGLGLVKKVKEGSITYIVPSTLNLKEQYKPKLLKIGIVWSSEYPFITPFAKMLRDKLNVKLEVIVYNNGLDATWDLVSEKIDLTLTPLITQALYYILTNRLTIIGGGAVGGASVFRNPSGRVNVGASTRNSTMDICLTRALKELGVLEEERLYKSSGEDIVRAFVLGKVEYAAVWEPFASRLKTLGFKEVADCTILESMHCCTLAATSTLERGFLERISQLYSRAIDVYIKNPYRWLEWYAVKTGIPIDELKKGIKKYTLKPYIEIDRSISTFKNYGLNIPSINVLKSALLR